MEVLKSQYKSLAEWRKADPSAVNVAYSRNLLPKIAKMFGWVYKTDVHTWLQSYNILLKFIKKYKKLPKTNEKFEDYNIGNWCVIQRNHYRVDKLQDKYINKLNTISQWKWDVRYKITNDEIFKIIKKYKNISELKRHDKQTYNAAFNRGLIDVIYEKTNWIKPQHHKKIFKDKTDEYIFNYCKNICIEKNINIGNITELRQYKFLLNTKKIEDFYDYMGWIGKNRFVNKTPEYIINFIIDKCKIDNIKTKQEFIKKYKHTFHQTLRHRKILNVFYEKMGW